MLQIWKKNPNASLIYCIIKINILQRAAMHSNDCMLKSNTIMQCRLDYVSLALKVSKVIKKGSQSKWTRLYLNLIVKIFLIPVRNSFDSRSLCNKPVQLPTDLWIFQKKLFLHNVIRCTLRTGFNVHKTKPSERKDIC